MEFGLYRLKSNGSAHLYMNDDYCDFNREKQAYVPWFDLIDGVFLYQKQKFVFCKLSLKHFYMKLNKNITLCQHASLGLPIIIYTRSTGYSSL